MEALQPFTQDGDYLITQCRAIGLGIMTADCMPIICIDKEHKAISVAHAGWRGAIAGIVASMVKAMQQSWQTNVRHCSVFFGPSAGQCCYEVGPEFAQYLAPFAYKEEVLLRRHGSYFFNNPLLISYQLQALGFAKESIDTTYNACTICDDRFYSHRRSQTYYSGRQMTVVALK
jgi:YfiH family protein